MTMGRPKLEIARTERLGLRLTKFEFEKIVRIAAKNLTKTDAILQGIDLLIAHSRNVTKVLQKIPEKMNRALFAKIPTTIKKFFYSN